MKILYLSPATSPDYQCDMLAHGLRSMLGSSFIDVPRISFLYNDYCDVASLYGKGFTLYGLLPDIEVDRANVEQRIRDQEFDLIIYGSIQRSQAFFDLVKNCYPRNRVIFVDGEDHPHLFNLSNHGIYFKRELYREEPGIHPIHFAIPVQKVGTIKPTTKSQVRSPMDPRDPSTYVYTDEKSYYEQYSRSLFAYTEKKAGWDALRHLEILANGCIPLFRDLEKCPPLTCTHLPKPELMEALTLQHHDGNYWSTEQGHSVWRSLWRRIHLKFIFKSTTVALAQYVLGIQQREAHADTQA